MNKPASTFSMAAAAHPSQPYLDSMAKAQLAWLEGQGRCGMQLCELWSDLAARSVDFVSRRLRHDVETQHLLMQCHSVPVLQEVQSAFFGQATRDYWEGMSQIAAAVGKLTPHEP
ncbi:hypothetical protein FGG78_37555 [Thioclava sp. BHET1]|nr:hypothetical protein FGG78_37555 [Thioclava sp. BHET1]